MAVRGPGGQGCVLWGVVLVGGAAHWLCEFKLLRGWPAVVSSDIPGPIFICASTWSFLSRLFPNGSQSVVGPSGPTGSASPET